MVPTMSKRPQSGKAVFLDRDGTINHDPGYISDPATLEILPGAGAALARLQTAGYKLIVVTNQSGIARGIIPPGNLEKIHDRMNELLAPAGARIDAFYFCPHHPSEGCPCRKPGSQLITSACSELGLDPKESVMIGDRETDLQCGLNAGVGRVVLVRTGNGRKTEQLLRVYDLEDRIHFTGDSLQDVATWILESADS